MMLEPIHRFAADTTPHFANAVIKTGFFIAARHLRPKADVRESLQ
jgi:hypothetical protein